jgi:hypothetical protein
MVYVAVLQLLLITHNLVRAGDVPPRSISSYSTPEDIDKLEQMRARQMRECAAKQDTMDVHVSEHTIQASEDSAHDSGSSIADGLAADHVQISYTHSNSNHVLADSDGPSGEKKTNVRQEKAVTTTTYPDRVCCCPPNWCPLNYCPPEVYCACLRVCLCVWCGLCVCVLCLCRMHACMYYMRTEMEIILTCFFVFFITLHTTIYHIHVNNLYTCIEIHALLT